MEGNAGGGNVTSFNKKVVSDVQNIFGRIGHVSLDENQVHDAIFEEFNKNCGKFLVPNDYLSLDDTLYSTKTQISFKQFNPSKPAKYGMLYKSINCKPCT